MKQFLSKIVSSVLAFLVLFSTFSFTVEKHYCGDYLVDVSYLGKADTCNSDGGVDKCATVIKKKKCCKDEVHQIDGQDEFQKHSLDDISFDKLKIVLAFYNAYQSVFQDFEKQIASHQYYSPPDLVKDIQVLHEVFII